MQVVVLLSGGLDSLSALLWAIEQYGKNNVTPLYVDLGHRYVHKEIEAVKKITNYLNLDWKLAKAKFVGNLEREDGHIPYRNLFLILTAVYHLPDGGVVVIQNTQTGEEAISDRRLEFNQEVETLLNKLESRQIEIICPFPHFTKGQIVKWLASRVPKDLIKETIGCFSPIGKNCGRCSACFRRWISLEAAGLIKNICTEYKEWNFDANPLEWEGVSEYIEKMKAGKYHPARVRETEKVLQKYGKW